MYPRLFRAAESVPEPPSRAQSRPWLWRARCSQTTASDSTKFGRPHLREVGKQEKRPGIIRYRACRKAKLHSQNECINRPISRTDDLNCCFRFCRDQLPLLHTPEEAGSSPCSSTNSDSYPTFISSPNSVLSCSIARESALRTQCAKGCPSWCGGKSSRHDLLHRERLWKIPDA